MTGRETPSNPELERLAAKLARPSMGLAALEHLTPEQVGLLTELIDEACARQRRSLDEALRRAIPALPHGLVLRILRGGGG